MSDLVGTQLLVFSIFQMTTIPTSSISPTKLSRSSASPIWRAHWTFLRVPAKEKWKIRTEHKNKTIQMNNFKCIKYQSHICSHQKFMNQRCTRKVQVGNDQEKAQVERDSHSKNGGGKKTKLTIRYLYHENIS